MATHGMLLGKFMPPQAGHRLLVDFARAWCDELTILLFGSEDDEIPVSTRLAWAEELFARATVRHIEGAPEFPAAAEDFANTWSELLATHFPDGLDYVFASEPYGPQLADLMGAQFVSVDPERELMPVRSSEVLEDPMEHWEFLPGCVRPHFVNRVCLIGPDGTGKSALAEQLAVHYDTVAAYAYKERAAQASTATTPNKKAKASKIKLHEVGDIVRGQLATEDALARHANRVLICDSDALTLSVWSQQTFGECPPEVSELAKARTYDLYLLMDVDMQWLAQGHNLDADGQQQAFAAYRQQLIERDLKYLRLDGDYDTRFRIACDAIDLMLGKPSGRPPRPPPK